MRPMEHMTEVQEGFKIPGKFRADIDAFLVQIFWLFAGHSQLKRMKIDKGLVHPAIIW